MKYLSRLALAALLFVSQPALAQQKTNASYRSGVVIMDDNGVVNDAAHTVHTTCDSGCSASSLVPFTPGATYASLTATGSAARAAFPAGAVVIVYNAGTTAVSCTPGDNTVVSVSNHDQIQPGSAVAYTPSTYTNLSCIDQSGSASNVVVMSGGANLPIGWGGGSSTGGGGGAVTVADGADVTLGAKADAKSTATDTTAVTAMQVLKQISASVQAPPTQAVTIATAPVLVAGSAIIGKVGIDQSTPGTTNGVYITNNGSADGTAKAGLGYSGIAGVAEANPTTCTTDTQCYVSLDAINRALRVTLRPSTAGDTTSYGLQSAASTNSTSVKGSAGVVTAMNLINTTTTIYYLRTYNASSAPTCSSATNFVRSWPIPPAAAAGGAGGIAVNLGPFGSSFSSGIAFCVTGGPSSTDNTNAATGVFVNLDYK